MRHSRPLTASGHCDPWPRHLDGAGETSMTNARIDRMMNELQSEPSTQFFQSLFGLARPGRQAARVDAVALDCVVGAFVAERTQRRDDHRVAVHLEKAA